LSTLIVFIITTSANTDSRMMMIVIITIVVGVRWHLIVVLICIYLVTKDDELSVNGLSGHLCIFEVMLIQIL
jgi:hypothetical protein